jgi:DnaJ-class molecular chaperone
MESLLKKICLIAAFVLVGTAILHAHEESETCPDCAGSGQAWDTCTACAGQGSYEEYVWSECGDCNGSGEQGGSLCYACYGAGMIEGWDWVTCNSCNGSGMELTTCDPCGGTGIIWLWVALNDAFKGIHYAEIGQRDMKVA